MSEDRRKGLAAVALIAVLLGVIVASLWAARISAAQQDERDDLELFLDAASAGWAEVTRQFFEVPESGVQTIRGLLPQMEGEDERLSLLAHVVGSAPDVDAAFIGLPDGSFSFVARSDEFVPGGFRTRVISFETGERVFTLGQADDDFTLLDSVVVDEGYDPRVRPWYTPIADGSDLHWTSPYVFSSSQEPGITHSVALRNERNELVAVIGMDISLTQLGAFLYELRPGENGEALVVTSAGEVVAGSSMDASLLAEETASGELALHQSNELFELLSTVDDGQQTTVQGRSSDGERTTVVRPAGARDEWYLAVQALDADFISEDSAGNAFEIFAVGVTAAAASAVLGLLALRYLFGLKQEAERDELTGVLNRRAAKRELRTILPRAKRPIHLAIVDLDDFKTINDEYGHFVGDRVLLSAAEQMQKFGETGALSVGRLGGDEFILFGEEPTVNWSELVDRIARPTMVNDRPYSVTASVGIAIAGPGAARDIDELLGAADQLLFEAKRNGGASYRHESNVPASV